MPHQNQNPWGNRKKSSSPEDMLAALIQKLRDAFSDGDRPEGEGGGQGRPSEPPTAGLGKLVVLILAVLAVQALYVSFYTIEPGEKGVVLRFGKHVRTTEPGLHFKFPYVEELIKVNVEGVRTAEFGFKTGLGGISAPVPGHRSGSRTEALMLTGDKNVIHVAWIVQYKISDPGAFLFNVRNVDKAVRDFSEMTLRRIVGNMDFDYVLNNREILAGMAEQELQDELRKLNSGVILVTLQLKDVVPPDPVKPAFNEVNEADQDMKRLVNEAEAYYNKIIPKARGDAKKMVEEAHGYAAERVNRAKGETARFNAIVAEYLAAPEVTRKRMYIETMQEVLSGVDHVYVMNPGGQPLFPLLNLDRPAGTRGAGGQAQPSK